MLYQVEITTRRSTLSTVKTSNHQVNNVLNSLTKLVILLNTITPAISELVARFEVTYKDFIEEQFRIQSITSVIFIALIIVIFLVLWFHYFKSLTRQIFRTKSLMTLIPVELLKKNRSLRELFISGGILRSLK